MLYDVKVQVRSREITYPQVTRISAQNVFESYLRDGGPFSITVTEYACKHYWETDRSLACLAFNCSNCDATFILTDDDLNGYAPKNS